MHSKLAFDSMFDPLKDLFDYSSRTFDVFSLVFVKANKRHVKNSKAGMIQVLTNQVDYGPKKLGKVVKAFLMFKDKPPDVLFPKISTSDLKFCLPLDHTDIMRLSMSKEPITGFGAALKRTRRTEKREEHKLYKPPDLEQDKHQDVSCLMLMKEEPPDAAYKPKPSQNINGVTRDDRTKT
ncbi:unnamed protein product [Arabis nemorensis]|uniref:Uncharacterized protein n=1 Tax=Arabis nemorensis TaxID=586526 RepID=A0A565BVU8_9BRAS|nr:unnamed protein product [Arabis nemorensis]